MALLSVQPEGVGGGILHIMDYTKKAPPKRDTFLRVQVYERAGISHVDAYERAWEVCHCGLSKDLQGLTGAVNGCKKK